MKILHLFPNSLFSNPYLSFIETNFNCDDHEFIISEIGGNTKIEQEYYSKFKIYNVSTFDLKDCKKIDNLLSEVKFDKLLIHSAYLNFLLLGLLKNKSIIRKATLILWGGSDARPFKVSEENKKFALHGMAYEFLRKKLYRQVKTIASIIPGDYETIKAAYHFNANYKKVKYPVPTIDNYLDKQIGKGKNDPFCIQVGHSGSPDGNVIEAYEILSKFKNENIKIYTPLSYGDENYIKKCLEKGRAIFGEKFCPITSLMDGETFSKFIISMDVLVMNTKIQQGLGNLYSYFYAKKKVILNEEGFLWQFFGEEKYDLESLQEVEKMTFSEFIQSNDKKITNNHFQSKKFFDNSELISLWKSIFDGGD